MLATIRAWLECGAWKSTEQVYMFKNYVVRSVFYFSCCDEQAGSISLLKHGRATAAWGFDENRSDFHPIR